MRRAARNSVSPYRAGFDARMAGKGPGDNPYPGWADGPVPSPERKEWAAGWNAADAQLKKQEGAK